MVRSMKDVLRFPKLWYDDLWQRRKTGNPVAAMCRTSLSLAPDVSDISTCSCREKKLVSPTRQCSMSNWPLTHWHRKRRMATVDCCCLFSSCCFSHVENTVLSEDRTPRLLTSGPIKVWRRLCVCATFFSLTCVRNLWSIKKPTNQQTNQPTNQ